MTKYQVELLAPAGSKEAFLGAIHAGADAVYLGGMKFGARGNAKNFTTDEMKKWIDYCHIYGVKVYVTVNTLIKENEIDVEHFNRIKNMIYGNYVKEYDDVASICRMFVADYIKGINSFEYIDGD